ncbi:MAG: GtrA family protein [Verrucomicrobiota bacterium]
MRELLKQFTGREHTPFVQFIKYAICGGIATAVSIVIFYVCAYWLMPALSVKDPVVRLLNLTVVPVSDSVRARNSMVDNFVAFILANLVAYLLNIAWVFKAGRHHWLVEIGLFYLVSGVSFVIGTALMGWLINHYGMLTTAAFGANILTSLLINFVMRKYVIFKG